MKKKVSALILVALVALGGVALRSDDLDYSRTDRATLASVDAAIDAGDLAKLKGIVAANPGFLERAQSLLSEESPLYRAWKAGKTDIVDFLLDSGMPPLITFEGYGDRQSLLSLAIKKGDAAAVARFLKRGVKFNLSSANGYPYCDMAVAISLRRADIAALLLGAGYDPNQGITFEDYMGKGGIDYPLTLAARSRNIEIVRLLLGAGANPDSVELSYWAVPATGSSDFAFSFESALDLAGGDIALRLLLLSRGAHPAAKIPGAGYRAKADRAGLRVLSEPSARGKVVATLADGEVLRALRTRAFPARGAAKVLWVYALTGAGKAGWVPGEGLAWPGP